MSFYNVTIRASTNTLANNLTISNNLNILSPAILAPGANTINLAGNWNNYGTAGFTEAAKKAFVPENKPRLERVRDAFGKLTAFDAASIETALKATATELGQQGQLAVGLQRVGDLCQVAQEQVGEVAGEAVSAHDSQHGEVGAVGGKGVGRHLPTVFA